ncbi:MAG: tRNA-dihydrouridine(16/17) synthase [NAD(P)(+)]-like protein [Marteilia pararefringens]
MWTIYIYNLHTLMQVRNVAAPMVSVSELPWRMMLREKYNVHLCFTPMLNAENLAKAKAKNINKMLTTCPEDRPLVIQLNGNDEEQILKASKRVEHLCDAIDINLGCPQNIAKKGFYGAFLADDWQIVSKIIKHLKDNLKIAVSVKIRIYDTLEKTLAYVKVIEDSGADFITVHGRTRDQKSMGMANWNIISAIRKALKIPVIANGNIQIYEDVEKCMAETGVKHVMSADGLQYNPGLFSNTELNVFDAAKTVIYYYEKYDFVSLKSCRNAIFKIIYNFIVIKPQLALLVQKAKSTQELRDAVEFIEGKVNDFLKNSAEKIPEQLFTQNNQPIWICQTRYRSQGKDEKIICNRKDIIKVLSLIY